MPDDAKRLDSQPVGKALVDRGDKVLDDSLKRLDDSAAPMWESHSEVGRTLLTLSSGALVLSITFVQGFLQSVPHPRSSWLLRGAWLGFAVTAICAIFRQIELGIARSGRMRIEMQRSTIRNALWQISSTENVAERFDAILSSAITQAEEVPLKAFKTLNRMSLVMLWSFLAGLLSLLGFAMINLPF